MLERLVAFGVVVAALFGLATLLRDEEAAPAGPCLLGVACEEPEPLESAAPACTEGCAPPAPAPKGGGHARILEKDDEEKDEDRDEKEERKEKDERENQDEREEKRDRGERRGKRGKD